MKQVVLSLSERKFDSNKARSKDFRPSKTVSAFGRKDFEIQEEPNIIKPGSLHLVCIVNKCLRVQILFPVLVVDKLFLLHGFLRLYIHNKQNPSFPF